MGYALWLLSAALATANDTPPSETEEDGGPPLAIPIDGGAPSAPVAEPPPRPRADRPPDLAHARALRTYRDQHLVLRRFGETRVGTTWDYAPYGRWGPRGHRFGWRAFPRPYVLHTSGLGVFQGPERLDVPMTLQALGADDERLALEQRIRTNRTLGNVGYGLGVVGVAASVVGLIALDSCCSGPILRSDLQTLQEAYTWRTVSISGVALMVGGFIGGTFPGARAERLQYDFTATSDLDTLEGRLVEHNEALAAELGLSPTDAVRLEGQARR